MYTSNKSFTDLDVYKNLYQAALIVLKKVIPKLPEEEKYNLKSQIRRASMSPCALIAEGYAKKHQKRNWVKYIKDAIGECNEMTVHLSFIKDIYFTYVESQLIEELITTYNISGKQLYRLGQSWEKNSSSL